MNTRPQFSTRSSLTQVPPQIYYVHPLMLRGLEAWREVFAHVRELGLDTVLTAPLFRRGTNASVFITRNFDELDPALDLGSSLEDGHLLVFSPPIWIKWIEETEVVCREIWSTITSTTPASSP